MRSLTVFLCAAPKGRNDWQLIGGGLGVRWPKIDEDLSVENILAAYSRSERAN